MNDEQIAHALDAYRDGTLTEAEAVELAAAISAGGPTAAAIRAAIAREGLIAQALDPVQSDDVVRMVQERIRAEASSSAFVAAWRRRRQPARRWRRWLVAAAVLALMPAAWWLLPQRVASPVALVEVSAPAPVIEAVVGSVAMMHGGERTAPIVGQAVEAGTSLELAAQGRVRLRHADGTRIVIDGPGRSAWSSQGSADCWTLDAGDLLADVESRLPAQQLIVRSGYGVVRVHGTRLRVTVGSNVGTVAVEHGEVGVEPAAGPPLTVHAGHGAVLTAGGAQQLALTGAPLLAWDFSAARLDARWHGGQLDPGPAGTSRSPCLAAQTFNDHGSMGLQLVDGAGLFTYADDVALTIAYWAEPAIDHLDLWLCTIDAGQQHWYTLRLPQLSHGRWATACVRMSELRPERTSSPPLRVGDVVVNLSVNLPSVPGRLYFDDLVIAPLASPFVRPLADAR